MVCNLTETEQIEVATETLEAINTVTGVSFMLDSDDVTHQVRIIDEHGSNIWPSQGFMPVQEMMRYLTFTGRVTGTVYI